MFLSPDNFDDQTNALPIPFSSSIAKRSFKGRRDITSIISLTISGTSKCPNTRISKSLSPILFTLPEEYCPVRGANYRHRATLLVFPILSVRSEVVATALNSRSKWPHYRQPSLAFIEHLYPLNNY